MNILVVEDTAVNAILLRNILSREGYQVRVAGSGDEALEMLQAGPRVHLILADIGLPGMNGLDFVREALALPGMEKTPVIFITGDDTLDSVQRAVDLNAGGYILKPILQPSLVLEHVNRALAEASDLGSL